MSRPFAGSARIAMFVVLFVVGALASSYAQGVATDNGCGSFLGSDTACGDGSRNPRPSQPGAPQPAPPMAASQGSWDEYDFTKPAQNWTRMAGNDRFSQMPPSLGGDVARTQGLTGMTRAQAQASGGNAGGMSTWLAVLAVFAGAAALAAGS